MTLRRSVTKGRAIACHRISFFECIHAHAIRDGKYACRRYHRHRHHSHNHSSCSSLYCATTFKTIKFRLTVIFADIHNSMPSIFAHDIAIMKTIPRTIYAQHSPIIELILLPPTPLFLQKNLEIRKCKTKKRNSSTKMIMADDTVICNICVCCVGNVTICVWIHRYR